MLFRSAEYKGWANHNSWITLLILMVEEVSTIIIIKCHAEASSYFF